MPQSSRSEKDKPFSEKLKSWFGYSKRHGFSRPQEVELELDPDTLKELDKEQPLAVRLKAIKDLQPMVKENRLQEHGVELLWVKVSDLMENSVEKEVRQSVLSFFIDLTLGQFNNLEMMRPQFFRFLKLHSLAEDLEYRIEFISALTDGGKDIVYVEDEIGVLLLELLNQLVEAKQSSTDFLVLVNNMVKFNSAYLDSEVVAKLIACLSHVTCASKNDPEILRCLETFNSVVVYSYVPPEALADLIASLCRVVNLAELTKDAWNTMRNLMGTHLGHSALYNLCQMIHNAANRDDVALIRGAVFYIGMSLWGSQRVHSLKYSAMTVLPTFMQALKADHQLVTYEVTLQVERLVVRHGGELRAPGWEEAVNLLLQLVTHLDQCDSSLRSTLHHHLQASITQLEVLAMSGKYPGSQTRLYDLVEVASTFCPEQSVIHLIQYRANNLHPAKPGWVAQLAGLVDKFYSTETRPLIRIQMLTILKEIVLANLLAYEDQLLDAAILPFLALPEAEVDKEVRIQAVQTVAALATVSKGKHLTDLLDVLDKILNKLTEGGQALDKDSIMVYTRADFDYIREAVLGMIKVFKTKLYVQPSSIARRCFYSLVNAVDHIYERAPIMEFTAEIRLEIFRCFLSLRANSNYHLGFPSPDNSAVYRYSAFMACEQKVVDNPKSPNSVQRPRESASGDKSVMIVNLTRACMSVVRCLKDETDWGVLHLVLSEIPQTLQNKGMFTRYGKSISQFATVLCSLVNDKGKLDSCSSKVSRSDFQQTVFPVLAALASYNKLLEPAMQQKLIVCLEFGLMSRDCNQVCIVALTACILEMSSSMNTLLPEVLLNLSKISATVHIATPVLEFLSTLISLPKVFASFNTDQYMSVFAITLPYTNPFKFNHYIVTLAHHVIIMWFLKCRLTGRRDFVKFISKGLSSNIVKPFEEGNFRKQESSLADLNQDSAGRKRSSSLKEDRTPVRTRHGTGVTARPVINKEARKDERQLRMNFHQELTETCLDLMARYSFANCSVQARRSPSAEFLLKDGQTSTWLLGTVLITITVSTCGQTANRNGLCDICTQLCGASTTPSSPASLRKRHSSAFTSRENSAQPPTDLRSQSRDDIEIRQKRPFSLTEPPQHGGDLCTCCCQGWCEVLVRRSSGVTSWVCRVQNGSLTGGGDLPMTDITSILTSAAAATRDPKSPADTNENAPPRLRTPVKRSNSNPEIGETMVPLDCEVNNRPRSRQSYDPIPEMEEEMTASSPLPKLSRDLRPRHSTADDIPSTPPVQQRDRAHTISTPSPTKPKPRPSFPSLVEQASMGKQDKSSGISPQFMFLQLYQSLMPTAYADKPLLLPQSNAINSSLKILDTIPCHETHKVGVLYVGQGQAGDEKAILSNQFGSVRYAGFLDGLGNLVDLTDVDKSMVFLGGLDPRDGDGQFAYVWQDDVMQVVFHAATLMPNRAKDPQCAMKKRHIGNDFVAIVYNEAGAPYTMGTVKGQFIYATIVVQPLEFETNKVSVLFKPELEHHLSHLTKEKVVSDQNLAMIVRQVALHCNLAANIFQRSSGGSKMEPYASNWLERLRHIKRLKAKVLNELGDDAKSTPSGLCDFTGFV